MGDLSHGGDSRPKPVHRDQLVSVVRSQHTPNRLDGCHIAVILKGRGGSGRSSRMSALSRTAATDMQSDGRDKFPKGILSPRMKMS